MRSQPWWTLSRGDIDGTIAQVGFIIAQMLIPVLLLVPIGVSFASASSISCRDLLWGFSSARRAGHLGVRLSKREHRTDVTAHAYGNNVPAIIALRLGDFSSGLSANARARSRMGVGAAAVVWTGILSWRRRLSRARFAATFLCRLP